MLLFSGAARAGEAPPGIVPLNPAFVRYMEAAASRGPAAKTLSAFRTTADGHALGKLPSPVRAPAGNPLAPLPRLKSAAGGYSVSSSSYDLRWPWVNKVTSVKNQGQCGSCWAHAAMGSLESFFMPENLNFSESDLDLRSGFDYGSCNGGTDLMSAAYMTRWSGPVAEGSAGPVVKHAQDIVFIPPRSASSDNNRIKAALLAYGGVAGSYYVYVPLHVDDPDPYYNSTTHSYYYDVANDSADSNHEITIVGWDDNYSASNFLIPPAGNGAFICKNSWGTGWGENGYFHVSYHDTVFGRDDYAVAYTGESAANYSRVYSYDPLGWVVEFGGSGWSANIFTSVASTETLNAVGFYTTQTGVSYWLTVYAGVGAGPTSGTAVSSKSGVLAQAGYHTIVLDTPVNLVHNDRFSVVLHTNESSHSVRASAALPGYSSQAVAVPGRSYYSADGANWSDFYNYNHSMSACLKAYATGGIDIGSARDLENLKVFPSPARFSEGQRVRFDGILETASGPEIYIYTVAGRLARKLSGGDISRSNSLYPAGIVAGLWDGKNSSGEHVASGLYLYLVKTGADRRTGKIGVFW
ncbi:MAG: lectin like domain-containing protein [Elusimicrobiales bacterium]|nr:lectin like domain-containing protein [Elusimicrobiales bacterium]